MDVPLENIFQTQLPVFVCLLLSVYVHVFLHTSNLYQHLFLCLKSSILPLSVPSLSHSIAHHSSHSCRSLPLGWPPMTSGIEQTRQTLFGGFCRGTMTYLQCTTCFVPMAAGPHGPIWCLTVWWIYVSISIKVNQMKLITLIDLKCVFPYFLWPLIVIARSCWSVVGASCSHNDLMHVGQWCDWFAP